MYCHTNNLAVVQEAAIGSRLGAIMEGFTFDGGSISGSLIYPCFAHPEYQVWIIGDPLIYEFRDFAAAADFIASELRLAN